MILEAVLLDTHCWLWLLTEPSRFSPKTLALLAVKETRLFLSVASIWEISIKSQLGKLQLPEKPHKYIPEKMAELGVGELVIAGAHAILAGQLPRHHLDPFDRLIIAQSQIEGIPILTSDRAFSSYSVGRVPM